MRIAFSQRYCAADVAVVKSKLAGLKWLGKAVTHAGIMLVVFVGGIALIGVAQRAGWIRSGDGMTAAVIR